MLAATGDASVGLKIIGSMKMFPVLMNAARDTSLRRRSIAVRSCISADAIRVSSWNVLDASRDSATTDSATSSPATIATRSSTSVNPRASGLRLAPLLRALLVGSAVLITVDSS
jgi:hypothetical protein